MSIRVSHIYILALSASAVSGFSGCKLGSAWASASGQTPPVGHYGCYSSPVTTGLGAGYGTTIYRPRQRQGDVWIDSDKQYAGPSDKGVKGAYVMDGRTLVARTGSFAPPGPKTHITYTPGHGKDPAALSIVFLDEDGNPSSGTTCVWSDSAH